MPRFAPSRYLNSIGGYAFAEVDESRQQVIEEHGEDYLIDLGVGDPTDPTPEIAVEAAVAEARNHPDQGYPAYEGQPSFREAAADWFERRFGVRLDPGSEITATLGSKQAVFSLPMAYLDPGDVALIPDPGYPPYTTGTLQRGAEPVFMPLLPKNDFLPDLDAIDSDDADRAGIMWLNGPNNPTTRIIPPSFYDEAIAFCRRHDILLCSDEAYSEMYYGDTPPVSLFERDGGREQGLVFHSLSKRSNMTNYRIGFVAGPTDNLDPFKEVQTNMHSGQAQILQAAGAEVYGDEDHVEAMRATYRRRRDVLVPHLEAANFRAVHAEGTFYVWARVPEGTDSLSVTRRLLEDAGINTTPGRALGQVPEHGDDFVRFALIQDAERTREAGERIQQLELTPTPAES